jgi:hypothetical protein
MHLLQSWAGMTQANGCRFIMTFGNPAIGPVGGELISQE